ncbi:hypothetical protein KAS79_00765 [Candidatus Parcubacteria bacterium]|nr:hypothetical protein [Candidatus Parcubacteria bacterium]
MKKYTLLIRKEDKEIFNSIKSGDKIIETRAATKKYQNIKNGDILVFVCEKEKIEKEVDTVNFFKNIEDMLKIINFKKIIPFAFSKKEIKNILYSFPNNREKIEKFGLIALELK